MATPLAQAAMLSAPTPFLLLEAAAPSPSSSASASRLRQRSVLLWLEAGSHPAGPLGALCWRQTGATASPRGGSSGALPLHDLSDVRLGSVSTPLRAAAAAAGLPAQQCLSLQYAVAACARSAQAASAAAAAATEAEYRGLRCSLHSLDLCAPPESESGGVDLVAWVGALLAHLERRLQRRLLTPAAHASLPLPVPSTLLHAAEGGIDVLLHSRPHDAAPLQSRRSVLWFNVARDALFWDEVDAEGTTLFPEHESNCLALECVSDVFVGMHHPLWHEVAAAAAAAGEYDAVPDDECALTLVGSQEPHAVPIELHVQTVGAPAQAQSHAQTVAHDAQKLLLDLIEYANDRSEEGATVQSNVVVHVTEEGRELAPRFYTPPPSAAKRSRLPVPTAVAAATAASPSAHAAAAAASPSHSPLAAPLSSPTSTAVSPSSGPASHLHPSSNPDLTLDPTMQCLLDPGMAVTIFSYAPAAAASAPNHHSGTVLAQSATLVYVHDHRSGMGQLRWSCDDGAAGRTNLEDVTDVHPACHDADHDSCLTLSTLAAGVRSSAGQKPSVVRAFQLHLCTASSGERIVFLEALRYALGKLGAALDTVSEELVPVVDARSPVRHETAPGAAPAAAAQTPVQSPPSSRSRARQSSAQLSASGGTTASPASSTKKTRDGSRVRSSSKTRAPSASGPRSELLYTPPPVVAASPPAKISSRTAARLGSLAQPRVRVDLEAEERKAKEAELEQIRKNAAVAAAKHRAAAKQAAAEAAAAAAAEAEAEAEAAPPAPRGRDASAAPALSRSNSATRSKPNGSSSTKKAGAAASTARYVRHAAPSPSSSSSAAAPAPSTPSAPGSLKKKKASSIPRLVAASDTGHTLALPGGAGAAAGRDPSPMPVSSPAQVLSSDSSVSPVLDSYTPQSSDAPAEAQILADVGAEAGAGDEEAEADAALAYDPENDSGLDFELDFTRAPALAPAPADAAAEADASPIADEANTTDPHEETQSAVAPPTGVLRTDELVISLSPMQSEPAPTPAPVATPAASQLAAAAAEPTASPPAAEPTATPSTAQPRLQGASFAGEPLDSDGDGVLAGEDDDLEDLFGGGASDHDDDGADGDGGKSAVDASAEAATSTDVAAASAASSASAGTPVTPATPAPTAAPIAAQAPSASASTPASVFTPASPALLYLSPLKRALQTLEAGCNFTSFTLSVPSDPASALREDKIFLWLNPRPTRSLAHRADADADAGALFWCEQSGVGTVQARLESAHRRIDIAHLRELFLGRQWGLLLRPELAHLPDEACLSLVAGEGPSQRELHLFADDAARFQTWMAAFNVMVSTPPEEDEVGPLGTGQAVPAASDAAAADAPAEAAPAKPQRVTVPLNDTGAVDRPSDPALIGGARVRLSTAAQEGASSRLLLQIANHWAEQQQQQQLSSNIALGQWCVSLMRAGVRVQLFEPSAADASEQPRVQRSFLTYKDADSSAPSGTLGSLLSSRCELDESLLLLESPSSPAATGAVAPLSPVFGSHVLGVGDVVEVVLGRGGGVWEWVASPALVSAPAPGVAHVRCASFLNAASSSLDVEFDSVCHAIAWILGVKFLLLHARDLQAFPLPGPVGGNREARAVPPQLRSLADSVSRAADEACVAARWSGPIGESAEDASLELLQRGALFELFASPAPASSGIDAPAPALAVPALSSTSVHVFYSFEDASIDGRFGSLYWNAVDDAVVAATGTAGAPEAPWTKSVSRRMELDGIAALLVGNVARGALVGADVFFRNNASTVLERLRHRGAFQAAECLTLLAQEDVLHMVFLRAADSDATAAAVTPSATPLDAWVDALEAVLRRAGRSLVLEASAGAGMAARWLSVAGGASAEAEVSALPFAALSPSVQTDASDSHAPAVYSVTVTPVETTSPATAPAVVAPPMVLVSHAQTHEYKSAAALLAQGRDFFSYHVSVAGGTSSDESAVVDRKLVRVFFSDSPPPTDLCNPALFDLPVPAEGEHSFPALWAIEAEEGAFLEGGSAFSAAAAAGGRSLPSRLQASAMHFSRCVSLFEITDLYLGSQNALFRSVSAHERFLRPEGRDSFDDERCLSIVASATGRKQRAHVEWNLEAIERHGLEQWINALSHVLPVHADGEAEAGAGAVTDPSLADAALALSPDHVLPNPMSPVSSLRHGSRFLLLQPAVVGDPQVLHSARVELSYLSAADLESLGADVRDPRVYPAALLPPAGEALQGVLFWRPLSDASFPGSHPLRRDEIRAEQVLPLHAVTDLFIGKETAVLRSDAYTHLNEDDCLSVVSNDLEWNLHSLAEGDGAAAAVVGDLLEALSALLKSGGKDLAAAEAAAGGGEELFGGESNVFDDAPLSLQINVEPAQGLPALVSPTAAHLLSPDEPLDTLLATLAQPAHKFDSALHALGVTLLHNHVAALEAQMHSSDPSAAPTTAPLSPSSRSMTSLVELGVGRQVCDSMVSFPRHEQLQSLGCATLWMLADSAADERALVQQGAIPPVLAALQNHAVSASVVQQAAGALRHLCASPAHAELVGDGGGLEALLAAVKSHPSTPAVQEQSLGALASLALVASNKTRWAHLGGLDVVVGVMRRFPSERALHEQACAALRNLAANHAANKTALAKLDALDLVVESLQQFQSSRPNQLHAYAALWNLTANCAPNKALLAAHPHAAHALLSTLRSASSSSDLELAAECAGVLRNMSGSGAAEGAESRARLVDSGVIVEAVASMRRFPSALALQHQCASLLLHLGDAHADAIVRAGGGGALLAALDTFIRDSALVEECCGALWMCTRADPALLLSSSSGVALRDVVRLADQALRLHPDHPGVTARAAGMRDAWRAAAAQHA